MTFKVLLKNATIFAIWLFTQASLDFAYADEAKPADERFAAHVQATFVLQGNRHFPARAAGPNSLKAGGEVRETFDLTAFVGVRPWAGGEFWANPEIDQGFGLANTLGAAGFSSGEAYKVGKAAPYLRLQRLFFRQTISIGGASVSAAPDINQLGSSHTQHRLILTVGKFSVTDIFDNNGYAHDPKGDFLNWSLIDTGSFDYPADAWGYSYGAATELYLSRAILRGGLFDLSKVPNSESLETGFAQYGMIGEVEYDQCIAGQEGKVRLTTLFNHGRMGKLNDALALAQVQGAVPDAALVRHFATRAAVSLNVEQAINDSLGAFLRLGFADGRYEAYEFTDVDRAVAVGLSLKGTHWHRPNDTIGFGLAMNIASRERLNYLAAGGLGILIGDSSLLRSGPERIIEAYYKAAFFGRAHVSVNLQLIQNPGYNRERGPVPIAGLRLHTQF